MKQRDSSSQTCLPVDIIIEILSRLPVNTLVRISCVCKFWRNLITFDPIFINCHLQKSLHNNNTVVGTVILRSDISHTYCKIPNPPLRLNLAKIHTKIGESSLHRILFPQDYLQLADCCNGVICYYTNCKYCNNLEIVLWNPALNQRRALPRGTYPQDNTCPTIASFIHDPAIDDYKVLKISYRHNHFKVEIYSLSNNSWKPINSDILPPCDQYLSEDNWRAVVHNGLPHWLAWRQKDSSLFLNVLDINQEKVREISLPSCVSTIKDPHLELFQGCLSISTGFDMTRPNWYELWVMKQHGINVSWIKQIVVPDNLRIRPLAQRTTGLVPYSKVLGETRWDSAPLQQRRGPRYLNAYDPETQKIDLSMADEYVLQESSLGGYYGNWWVIDYVASLVSVIPPPPEKKKVPPCADLQWHRKEKYR